MPFRLLALSLAEWRHHPWRHGAALLAVALGVALASSVQLINASALDEFAHAVRSASGRPDVVIAARERRGFDDALLDRLLVDPEVAAASPVVEIDTEARRGAGTPGSLRVLGIDALVVAAVAPGLMPHPAGKSGHRLRIIDPGAAFLNAAAMKRLGAAVGDAIELQSAAGWRRFDLAGTVGTPGAALAVIDIAAAQAGFDRAGRLSRIDVRLAAGIDPARWREAFERAGALPADARWASAGDAIERVDNLSRAYRVNLGVLALVALLVGAFLVYSVVSLSVAQRTPMFALLGVLGLAAADRRKLVLAENAIVGAAGSALGLAGGTALAALALRVLGGDLGAGYFSGAAPTLAWPPWPMAGCAALGVAAAMGGAWWPARAAERLAPAMALKGLGAGSASAPARWWVPLALVAAGALLALAPPVAGLPLAAYAAVGLLLAGGVAAVPAVVGWLLARRSAPTQPLLLLALRYARWARQTASATVAGIVASLALSVALTVMVASFRDAVGDWLDTVLPADLYARTAAGTAASDQTALPSALVASAAALPGVARVAATRFVPMTIDARQPPVALIARALGDDPARTLPLVGTPRPAAAGEVGVWVSEPAAALYGWRPGSTIGLPVPGLQGPLQVRGVWRDYARQFGAVAIDLGDYRRLTGDARVNDLALWLVAGASPAAVQAALVGAAGPDHPLEVSSAAQLRRISFAIFDRSFAVTRWLQAVAIAVGLIGVGASLSAQVLARRKQFGLLAHLGLARRQILWLVSAEAGVWLVAGTLIGLALGIAVALVLVFVVNPQSFHWTMLLRVPALPLAALAAAMLGCGTLVAWLSARQATGVSAVMAVKEDW